MATCIKCGAVSVGVKCPYTDHPIHLRVKREPLECLPHLGFLEDYTRLIKFNRTIIEMRDEKIAFDEFKGRSRKHRRASYALKCYRRKHRRFKKL